MLFSGTSLIFWRREAVLFGMQLSLLARFVCRRRVPSFTAGFRAPWSSRCHGDCVGYRRIGVAERLGRPPSVAGNDTTCAAGAFGGLGLRGEQGAW